MTTSLSTMTQRFKLKDKDQDIWKIISFSNKPSWNELLKRISVIYSIPANHISLAYVDAENDEIMVDSENALRDYYESFPDTGNAIKFIVHNLVPRVDADLLSEAEFLRFCPPPIDYFKQVDGTGSPKSNYTRLQLRVVTWNDFKDKVNNAVWDDTPKYPRPKFLEFSNISSEEILRRALNSNVLRPLNTILGGGEEFCHHSCLKNVVGEPDFIQRDSNNVLRLAIEVKTKWAFSPDNDDLAMIHTQNPTNLRDESTYQQSFATQPSIYDQLRQIFGYLSHNHLRFGAITTYERTWFLYRYLDRLCISPAIRYDDQQPTLFQCFFYITSLARDEHDYLSTLPSPPPSPRNDDNEVFSCSDVGSKRKAGCRYIGERTPKKVRTLAAGRKIGVTTHPSHLSNGEGCTSLEFLDWGSFRVLDVLGTGHSGTVFKAILRGEIVALKICDFWQHPDYEEELLNEVEVYHALKDLQGGCIPRFKGAGYTAGGLFFIATEIVGMPLEDVKLLSDQDRLAIQTGLACIHRHGFVHGDIRKPNILVKRDGHQSHVSFIDFAFSKKGRRRDFQKEEKLLAMLLKCRN